MAIGMVRLPLHELTNQYTLTILLCPASHKRTAAEHFFSTHIFNILLLHAFLPHLNIMLTYSDLNPPMQIVTTSFSSKALALVFILCATFIPASLSQGVCDTTPTTWNELLTAIHVNFGTVFLCPFTIKGNACHTRSQGYLVKSGELTLLCEPSYSGTERNGCVIDCPGTHFDIHRSGSLLLDGVTLKGATTSAVKVQSGGNLLVYNSIFERNINDDGNGGAITARRDSTMTIMYSRFVDNRGLDGGGIYHLGEAYVKGSMFLDNKASEGSGGAIYTGSEARSTVLGNGFAGNSAAFFGPAVFDGSGGGNLQELNSGCGNVYLTGAHGCDGIAFLENSAESCNIFSEQCNFPTSSPIIQTLSPSSSPSKSASVRPSLRPTQYSSAIASPSRTPISLPDKVPSIDPSLPPSMSPTIMPSSDSIAPSRFLSSSPSAASVHPAYSIVPSKSSSLDPTGSQPPSIDKPSQSSSNNKLPSQLPSLVPDESQSPTIEQSTRPTDSKVPSNSPSLLSSGSEGSVTELPPNPSESTLVPIGSQGPAGVHSTRPTGRREPSKVPSIAPSELELSHDAPSADGNIRSGFPSLISVAPRSELPSIDLSTNLGRSQIPSGSPSMTHSGSQSLNAIHHSVSPTNSESNYKSPSLDPSGSQLPSTNLSTHPSGSQIPSGYPSIIRSTSQVPAGVHHSVIPTNSDSLLKVPSLGPSGSRLPSANPSTHPSGSQIPSGYPSMIRNTSQVPAGVHHSISPTNSDSLLKVPSLGPSGSQLPSTNFSTHPSGSQIPSGPPSMIHNGSPLPTAKHHSVNPTKSNSSFKFISSAPSGSQVPSTGLSTRPSESQIPSKSPSMAPKGSQLPAAAHHSVNQTNISSLLKAPSLTPSGFQLPSTAEYGDDNTRPSIRKATSSSPSLLLPSSSSRPQLPGTEPSILSAGTSVAVFPSPSLLTTIGSEIPSEITTFTQKPSSILPSSSSGSEMPSVVDVDDGIGFTQHTVVAHPSCNRWSC